MFVIRRSIRSGGRASWLPTALFSLLVLFSYVRVEAQSILTVAGGGPIGDGKLATQGVLRVPTDVAVDADDILYIVDSLNQRIRRVDPRTQIITTFAGGGTSGPGEGGPATAAEMSPNGIAIFGGDVYISEGFRIRKVPRGGGNIITVAGGGDVQGDGIPATRASLNGTNGLAFDAGGNLYIAMPFDHRVRKVDAQTGLITTVAGTGVAGLSGDGGQAIAAQLDFPWDVAIDSSGNLLIGEWGRETRSDSGNSGRVRRVDAKTGLITTIVGGGNDSPRDRPVPALSVALSFVQGLSLDKAGNLFISVGATLRVDTSGNVTTYAGRGGDDFTGDGGPARDASLNFPAGIALDGAGNLFIADSRNLRVRRVDAGTGIITTAAGSGAPADDGLPATAAALFNPWGVALDRDRNLYVAEHFNYRIRKINAASGVITTFAGTGSSGHTGDGGPAIAARMREPWGLAFDNAGSLYVSTRVGQVRKIDARTGLITTVIGNVTNFVSGFAGDGGPAAAALINHATGITFDAADNLYIADTQNHRVRKVDATTGIITTIAGSGPIVPDQGGFSGDGGPATSARLSFPAAVAVDKAGNVYVADERNDRVRRIDAATGVITTFAGSGPCCSRPPGDDGPATEAQLAGTNALAFDGAGNLLIGENHSVRRVDVRTGVITTIIGDRNRGGFTGDAGPALMAGLSNIRGLAIDPTGNIFISDSLNNRVRAVKACVSLTAPGLIAPADGANLGTAPTLTWTPVEGAFRYDVSLAPESSALQVVASDITGTSFTPSNLQPGVRYFWRVVAKGDPFCTPFSSSSSPTQSFTTDSGCSAPPSFTLLSPSDGASTVSTTPILSWQPSSNVSTYDLFLGTATAPPFFAATTSTTFAPAGLVPGTTYYWNVIAHAACDTTKTTTTPVRSFRVSGGCAPPGNFSLRSPASGAVGVSTSTTFEWSPSASASSYDLFLGTTNPPPIFLQDLTATTLPVSGLFAATPYFWRVVAKVACDPSKSLSTPISTFTTRAECASPGGTNITFTPPGNVGIGQTYVVAWADSEDLGVDGTYMIERSLSASFDTILDSQQTPSTSASFVTTTAGTYYHRVRPVKPCSTVPMGPPSSARSVTVVGGTTSVIFTVQPQAVLTRLTEKLEDKRTPFTLENLGSDPVQVIVGKAEINSVPFFTIVDPLGGDSVFVTLAPRNTKSFEVRFSGPPNDVTGTYEGIIFLAATGKGLSITPYAFVNLKVGDSGAVRPVIRFNGAASEYAFFPGFPGADTARGPITIEVRNNGSAPMELGAEIGPEVWLRPESGWNATAIPPGATRSVRLFTQRDRAPNGSALPRYTYLTLRSKAGGTARLLVQDNDAASLASGRAAALAPGIRSYVIPEVVSGTSVAGVPVISRLRLTNVGSEAVQTELFFTPTGSDGFDAAAVRRSTVIVPPNDVVTLTDPLVQLFGLTPAVSGQIEVVAAPERSGLLLVGATAVSATTEGGEYEVHIPTLARGEGARQGSPHILGGITASAGQQARLILAETSGIDRASVRAVLYDGDGSVRGERTFELPRYGRLQVDSLLSLFGGSALQAAAMDLNVQSGGGAVVALVNLTDAGRPSGAVLLSRPAQNAGIPAAGLRSFARRIIRSTDGGTGQTLVIPTVVNLAAPVNPSTGSVPSHLYTTLVGFSAGPSAAASFVLTYIDSAPASTPMVQNLAVSAGRSVEYRSVLAEVFRLPAGSQGKLLIDASVGGHVYAMLTSTVPGAQRSVLAGAVPVLPLTSQAFSGGGSSSQKPLYFDGMEQSIDPSRGSRWNLNLDELRGRTSVVTVRLYEAGNRLLPIAEKEFTLQPREQLRLETVFSALSLDSDDRRKDRTNVQVVVTPKTGEGLVAATAISIDNRTGDRKTILLSPTGGIPATGINAVQFAAAVPQRPSAVPSGRRRATRRP